MEQSKKQRTPIAIWIVMGFFSILSLISLLEGNYNEVRLFIIQFLIIYLIMKFYYFIKDNLLNRKDIQIKCLNISNLSGVGFIFLILIFGLIFIGIFKIFTSSFSEGVSILFLVPILSFGLYFTERNLKNTDENIEEENLKEELTIIKETNKIFSNINNYFKKKKETKNKIKKVLEKYPYFTEEQAIKYLNQKNKSEY